jgi:peptidoglycan-N-acetylglucosamine deacetylase
VGIKNLFLAPALQSRELACVGWNVRSFDAGSSDPKAVVARVMARVGPGAIVLMHEGRTVNDRVRVHALELLLAALQEKQIACVVPTPEQLR